MDEEKEEKDEMSKELKKQIKHYKIISDQFFKIAKTLEEWGYNNESVSIDGHSPLTLAA